MNARAASLTLGTLAQPHRRDLIRVLVQHGPAGMTASAIAARLGLSPSALSFHLKELDRAGLVRCRREGRFRRYAAEPGPVHRLIEHLVTECLDGRPSPFAMPEPASRGRRHTETGRDRMADRIFNVLFLCTGNSARSVIAECLLNRWGARHFRTYSAGSHPRGEIHPHALDILRQENFEVDDLRSNSWDEFAVADAPRLDFVFTVCDRAAAEVCPVWPGQPMTAHWGIPDPAAIEGREAERRFAFADTLRMLTQRISIFVSLPIESLDRLALKRRLESIGRLDARADLSA